MKNIYILLLLLLFSCTQAPKKHDEPTKERITNTELALDSSIVETSEETEQDTSTNFKDAQGRKQGKWVTLLYGKPWKVDFYKNNKLHGQCYEYLENGEVRRTDYINGKRYGYFLHYHPDSTVADFVSYNENDTFVWFAFPVELHRYFVPIKGFMSSVDSVYIKIPYTSGQLFYEGMIQTDAGQNGSAVGIHKIYYETGQLKALVNYEEDSIIVYNKNSDIIKSSKVKRRTF